MKKITRAGLRFAALAATSAIGLTIAANGALAQAWFELRTWSAPDYYEAPPPVEFYCPTPRYAAPSYEVVAPLPRRAVRRIVEQHGFTVTGRIQLTGDVYIVPVEDRRGRISRIVVDALDGELVERLGAGGAPRPPANVGRWRDRSSALPDVSQLPPLPAQPRNRWREESYGTPAPPPAMSQGERIARERFARQNPDGAEGPRGRTENFEVLPGLGPVAPPKPKAADAKSAPTKAETKKQRTTKTPEAAKPKQQAARTPPEKSDAPAPEAVKPDAAKAEVVKPEISKPELAKTEASKPDVSKPQAEKPKKVSREQAKSQTPADSDVKSGVTAVGKSAAKPETRKEDGKRNASILRRPSNKVDDAKADARKGVAEAPVTSTGAEPQRKAPRVVYPGPGAPATATQTPGDSD